MEDNITPDKFILECFQHSLTGRLGHGIVHNLNGPLQILSMQLEMVKMDLMKCQATPDAPSDVSESLCKLDERIAQISDVIMRLEAMIQILGYRGEEQTDGKQPMPVDMIRFLQDLLEFWNSDLYFKHRVEKEVSFPDTTIFQVMDESRVLAMLDGVMSAFIYCIKARDDSTFGLTLEPYENGRCRIVLEHTGRPIPEELCKRVLERRKRYVDDGSMVPVECRDVEKEPELFMALMLGAIRSVEHGWDLELEPQRVVLTSPGQQT